MKTTGWGLRIHVMLVFALVTTLMLPPPSVSPFDADAAQVATGGTLGDLEIGDRVVDPSWEWFDRPLIWIVVAKDHYAGLPAHVTLFSEAVVERGAFDNSQDRREHCGGDLRMTNSQPGYDNRWGYSGYPVFADFPGSPDQRDATFGLRPWLNSTGIHAPSTSGEPERWGEFGFYEHFSEQFKSATLLTPVPNREPMCLQWWEYGEWGWPRPSPYQPPAYTTHDRVFVPSMTELGPWVTAYGVIRYEADYTPAAGSVWAYFGDDELVRDARRIESDEPFGKGRKYWTRSPNSLNGCCALAVSVTDYGSYREVYSVSELGIRPAMNLDASAPVSSYPNDDGAYVLFDEVAHPIVGEVVSAIGDVTINGVPADGTAIRMGDLLKTGDDSFLFVRLNLGQGVVRTWLNENSEVRVEPPATPDPVDEDLLLELFDGELRAKIEGIDPAHLEIRTTQAVPSVRGTDFLVATDETTTRVTVLDGQVEVANLDGTQSVDVHANFAVEVTGEAVGTPFAIDPGALHRWWEGWGPNVPPSLDLTIGTADEGAPVVLDIEVTDPDGDDLTVGVDWGFGDVVDPVTGSVTTGPEGTTLEATMSHVYGDVGAFPVEVCAEDGSVEVCETVTAVIFNVDPDPVIDVSGATAIDGVPYIVATVGEPMTFSARTTDPGSDDLELSWDLGDGTSVTSMSLVNPPNPDPPLSPSIQPRDVTDIVDHAYADACGYAVTYTAVDDDGGVGSDKVAVLIVGDADRVRSAGYWQEVYRLRRGSPFDEATLLCYLQIVDELSQVFSEVTPASTLAEARDVLVPPRAHDAAATLERQLLAALLNFANGGIGWDEPVDSTGDGVLDAPFGEVVQTAETVRLDATTPTQLMAQKDALERINVRDG